MGRNTPNVTIGKGWSVIENQPFDEYCKLEGMNASTLKALCSSRLLKEYKETHGGGDTPSTRLGRNVHEFVLERHVFLERLKWLVTEPEKVDESIKHYDALKENGGSGNTYTGIGYKDCELEHLPRKKTVFNEMMKAMMLAKIALLNPEVEKLIANAIAKEVTVTWDGGEPFGWCKMRADLIGPGYICDIKTVGREAISPLAFGFECRKYLYDLQGRWYLNGASAACSHPFFEVIDDMKLKFLFIAISSNTGESVVYETPPGFLESGERNINLALNTMLDNRKYHGAWHGVQEIGGRWDD
jgi:hypothetical protein